MIYEIWKIKENYDSTYYIQYNEKLLVWDLLDINWDLFLVMDFNQQKKEISWQVNYIWNLFTPTTVYFQKFLKNYWYSWYFKFFNLYIQNLDYIKRYKLPNIKKHKLSFSENYISEYKNYDTYCGYLKMWQKNVKCIWLNNFSLDLLSWDQNLLVFPDNWSLFNFYEKFKIWEILDLNSTSLTRYKTFLKIKEWKLKTLLTTHWGVFQDWKKLKTIFVFFPYKWYYKNQQNPRYYLPELAKQIAFFYNVDSIYFIY